MGAAWDVQEYLPDQYSLVSVRRSTVRYEVWILDPPWEISEPEIGYARRWGYIQLYSEWRVEVVRCDRKLSNIFGVKYCYNLMHEFFVLEDLAFNIINGLTRTCPYYRGRKAQLHGENIPFISI